MINMDRHSHRIPAWCWRLLCCGTGSRPTEEGALACVWCCEGEVQRDPCRIQEMWKTVKGEGGLALYCKATLRVCLFSAPFICRCNLLRTVMAATSEPHSTVCVVCWVALSVVCCCLHVRCGCVWSPKEDTCMLRTCCVCCTCAEIKPHKRTRLN